MKLITKILGTLLIFCVWIPANAQLKTYTIDPLHTSVGWYVEHYSFSTVSGKFLYITGEVKFDPKDIKTSSVSLVIPVKHINTGISELDKNLLSSDFFDVEKYPVATFTSTGITDLNKNSFDLIGNLTLHGVTRKVVLHVKFNGSGLNYEKIETIGFSANTYIDRTKYGISKYSSTLGKKIKLNIQLEANLKTHEGKS